MGGERMSLVKKVPRALEFEVFVKVYCPHCAASEKSKEIGIMLPARGLPANIKCFNCEGNINTSKVFTTGKEKIQREDCGTKIKGICS